MVFILSARKPHLFLVAQSCSGNLELRQCPAPQTGVWTIKLLDIQRPGSDQDHTVAPELQDGDFGSLDSSTKVLLRNENQCLLTSDEDGRVSLSVMDTSPSFGQTWTVIPPRSGCRSVSFMSSYGRFLCCDGGIFRAFRTAADRTSRNAGEEWYVLDDKPRSRVLRSCVWVYGHDTLPAVSCVGGEVTAAHFGEVSPLQCWDVIPVPSQTLCDNLEPEDGLPDNACVEGEDGIVRLYGAFGYLCADPDRYVRGNVHQAVDGQTSWALVKIEGDRYAVRSQSLGLYLRRAPNGKLVADMEHHSSDDTHFMLTPISTTVGMKHRTLVTTGCTAAAVLGGAAVVTSLAIPLAGFGVGGVVGGSLAAAIQSAVYGGATTGVFSLLQSVGATSAWITPAALGSTWLAGGVAGLKSLKHREAVSSTPDASPLGNAPTDDSD